MSVSKQRWELKPLKSIGPIEFGADREEVRKILESDFQEYKKTASSLNTTDTYDGYHVFYTQENKCKAVEIFGDMQVILQGVEVFPAEFATAVRLIPDLMRYEDEDDPEYPNDGEYLSRKWSVGLGVDEGKVDSLLVGCDGYYSEVI